MDIDLFQAELKTCHECVVPHGLGKGIQRRISIVRLRQIGDRRTDDEGIEAHVLNALDLRRQRINAGRSRTCDKALRGERRTHTANGLAYIVGVAHETQAKLIHGGSAKSLGIPETDQLSASKGQGVESGDSRPSLPRGIRIVQPVVIEIVVRGQLPPMLTVGVYTETRLVVSYDLSLRGGRKSRVPSIGIGDVLQ